MFDTKSNLKQEHNIFLAFMECFTSCVLTYLNIKGLDYRKLLLDYWNLNYESKTLLSSKNATELLLSKLYGIELKFVKGNIDGLADIIRAGGSVICLCLASKLAYFPRKYLGMESNGFGHAILIDGWDEKTAAYIVADPVVDIVVHLSPQQLMEASSAKIERQEIYMFSLLPQSTAFIPPPIASVLAYCTERILHAYQGESGEATLNESMDTGGGYPDKWKVWQNRFRKQNNAVHAWRKFEHDFKESERWPDEKKVKWIKQNTMMISSIKGTRVKIWNTYCELAKFDLNVIQAGQKQIDVIVKSWNVLHIYLLKYERIVHGDSSITANILEQMKIVQSAEVHFLEWLVSVVSEGGQGQIDEYVN